MLAGPLAGLERLVLAEVPDIAEPVTNVGLHKSFAVSVLSKSTARLETGRSNKRESQMAKRQKKSSFVQRLKQSFHRFWNE
jgi:hypothetical protein